MLEERLIELLNIEDASWREKWDDPFEAADELGIDVEEYNDDDYAELCFD